MDDSIRTASNEVLEHEVTQLAANIAAATCRFLLLIGELDARDAWGSWGCRSMAHWVAWRCSMSRRAAFEHVRIARALRSLPRIAAIFGEGQLSYSKVRVLTRIANAENEADLVDLARTATAAQLETIVRATLTATEDPSTRAAMRELWFDIDGDGLGTVNGRGPIDGRAIIETAVAAAMASGPKECPAEHSSIAGRLPQRRWDALVRICESYLANGDHARAPHTTNNAVVHVAVDESGVTSAQTDGGTPVPIASAERILCDSTVQGMLGDCRGPIGSGRQTRTINRKLRRALNRRSGGRCEWSGCDERVYLQGHHVWHWTNGGPTELWNLVNLCWHHHHLIHDAGWTLEHDGRGGVLPAGRRPRRRSRPDENGDTAAVPAQEGSHRAAVGRRGVRSRRLRRRRPRSRPSARIARSQRPRQARVLPSFSEPSRGGRGRPAARHPAFGSRFIACRAMAVTWPLEDEITAIALQRMRDNRQYAFVGDDGDFVLVDPWTDLRGADVADERERSRIAEELAAELKAGHPLHEVPVEVVGRCEARDDFLLRLVGDGRWAIVHLTWRRPDEPPFPSTRFFDDASSVDAVLRVDSA